MKIIFYALVSMLLFSCPRDARTDPIEGRDLLAAQSKDWNLKATLKYPEVAFGSLDNTFGSDLAPIRKILETWKPKYYRVHLINGPCIRNGNCERYEIGYGYGKASFDKAVSARNPKILKYIRDRSALYHTLANTLPDTTFLLSPELEHDLSKKSWRVLADNIRMVWGGVRLVNSPDGGVAIEKYLDSWIERHGNAPQSNADINSLDGIDATQISMGAWKARSSFVKIRYVWQGTDNCRDPKNWQDPRVRDLCTNGELMELLAHIVEDVPPPPPFTGKGCVRMSKFRDPDIWKPAAEYAKNDNRSFKPVLITKAFGKSTVYVLASNGGQVGSLGYYSNYLDQGNRYYSGYRGGSSQSGYEYQKAAVAATGSPWVWLKQGRVCKGPLVPGRRQGKPN